MSKDKRELFHRDLEIRDIDEPNQIIEVAFASGTPVPRSYGYEVLTITPESVRTDRLTNGGIPVLCDHNRDKHVGRVISVDVSDGVARAKIKFSTNSYAQEVFRDITDEIRPGISFGYLINEEKVVRTGEKIGNEDVYRIDEYEVYEISSVSIPADPMVGVGRDTTKTTIKTTKTTESNNGENSMSNETKTEERAAPTVEDTQAARAKARKEEKARVREISALAARYDMVEDGDKFIDQDNSVDQFRSFVLDNIKKEEAPINVPTDIRSSNADDTPEVEKYDFMKAIRAAALGGKYKKEAEFEIGFGREMAQDEEVQQRGEVYIPHAVLSYSKYNKRDMTAGGAATGKELVGTDHLAGSFIETLENKMVIKQAGATVLDGLVGNVDIPKKTAGSTFYWIDPENTDITDESNVGTGSVVLRPHDGGVYTDISRRLILQSAPSVQAMVQNDLALRVALGIDRAGFYGTGADGQPLGIAYQSGVYSQYGSPQTATSFAAALPTFVELVAMQAKVASANAEKGGAFVSRENDKHNLRAVSKDTGSGRFVVENSAVDGYPIIGSNQVDAGDIFYSGDWSDLIIGMWGGLDLLVDTSTGSKAGTTRLVVFQTCDVAVKHGESFIVSNDS